MGQRPDGAGDTAGDPAAEKEAYTARLFLRPMIEADWPLLRRIDGDPETTATLGGLRSEPETQAYVFAQIEHWSTHGFGWWTAFDRVSRSFVGRGGLRRFNVEGVDEVEVGYAIVRDRWGEGLATELAAAAVHVADASLGLDRLVAVTLPENHGSRRVLEKVGFAYERQIMHASLPHVLYARTAGAR